MDDVTTMGFVLMMERTDGWFAGRMDGRMKFRGRCKLERNMEKGNNMTYTWAGFHGDGGDGDGDGRYGVLVVLPISHLPDLRPDLLSTY
ncbi:hypothetical protein VTJ04DRAFT_4927 [Mycothermus thermophilus]|uniref:uncharacterized protein n=1 Tax=Humicola insolens TaxID=85995 RepID=UPI0037435935